MQLTTVDRFEGTMLGLALGDAFCAPYEGGPVERLMWTFLGKTRNNKKRWTDDTQMSLDLASSIVLKGGLDQDHLASQFAMGYRWSRGYGPGAAKILKRIRRGESWQTANTAVFPDGSYGNGAAMRAPIIGLAYHCRPAELDAAARKSAEITHSHPMGIDGARAVAHATAAVLNGAEPGDALSAAKSMQLAAPFADKIAFAQGLLSSEQRLTPKEVRGQLGTGLAAIDSAVTAVYIGVRFRPRRFEEMLEFVSMCGGDTDTVAAMAGAIWGAAHGVQALPAEMLGKLEGEGRIRETAQKLFAFTRGEQGNAMSRTTLSET